MIFRLFNKFCSGKRGLWVHFLWFKCSLNCSINFAREKEGALCEPAVALWLWQVSFVNPPYNPSIYWIKLNSNPRFNLSEMNRMNLRYKINCALVAFTGVICQPPPKSIQTWIFEYQQIRCPAMRITFNEKYCRQTRIPRERFSLHWNALLWW